MVLVIDIETTGLYGYPIDRVLEIGIVEYDGSAGRISPLYNEMIRYEDIREFDSEYENMDGTSGIWFYRNTDARIEDTLNAEKGLKDVVKEVRDLVRGKEITAYNNSYDFDLFLYKNPWNLHQITRCGYDIMLMASRIVNGMAEDDAIGDKELQRRLLSELRNSRYPSKWVRSIDAYDVLCPDDPLGTRGRQTHRAMDDAMMEAHILGAVSRIGDVNQFS